MKIREQNARERILLIDDEEDFRQLMTKLLVKSGFEPVVACSGEEGIMLAAQQPPDLILCDLEMPGMHGHEVLAALRRDPKLAEIPVLFLTGRSAPEEVRQGMNLGADDYLTKPVNQADLLQAIQVRLQRRQGAQDRLKKQQERALQLFAGAVQD